MVERLAGACSRIGAASRFLDLNAGGAEIELHRRPCTWRAFDPRGAARLARHSIDHRQPEPGSLADLLGREERLERAGGNLRSHANAGVADRQFDIGARIELGVIVADLDDPIGDRQRAAVGHRVAPVDRKVEQRDFDLGRVGHHRHQLLVEREALLDPGAKHVAQDRPHVVDQRGNEGRPDLEPLDPAERQQLPGQPRSAFGRGQRILGVAKHALVG